MKLVIIVILQTILLAQFKLRFSDRTLWLTWEYCYKNWLLFVLSQYTTNTNIFSICLDLPRIVSFYGTLSGNNSLTITCRGEGQPKPTYKIFADDTEVKETIGGMAIIRDNIENNETMYKCIAMNNLGHSTKHFSRSSLSSLKGEIHYILFGIDRFYRLKY